MKAFADNNLYLVQAVQFVLNVEENNVGKGESVKHVIAVLYNHFTNSFPNDFRLGQIESICRQQN